MNLLTFVSVVGLFVSISFMIKYFLCIVYITFFNSYELKWYHSFIFTVVGILVANELVEVYVEWLDTL